MDVLSFITSKLLNVYFLERGEGIFDVILCTYMHVFLERGV
jgi:hypothetical protein